MAKKKSVRLTTRIAGACFIYSTEPMVCPLCHITVPANTPHKCVKDA